MKILFGVWGTLFLVLIFSYIRTKYKIKNKKRKFTVYEGGKKDIDFKW